MTSPHLRLEERSLSVRHSLKQRARLFVATVVHGNRRQEVATVLQVREDGGFIEK